MKYIVTVLLVLMIQMPLGVMGASGGMGSMEPQEAMGETISLLSLDDFGTAPIAEMECIRGACRDDSKKHIITATYMNTNNPDQFFGYDITQPHYDYYNDELFRISFKLVTEDCDPDFYLDSIEDALVDQYGMEFVGEGEYEINADYAIYVVDYSSESGVIAHISWSKTGECWSNPRVRVQN